MTIVMKLLTQSSKCLKSLRPHSTRFETDHKLTHFGSTYLDGFYMKSTKSTTGRQFSTLRHGKACIHAGSIGMSSIWKRLICG